MANKDKAFTSKKWKYLIIVNWTKPIKSREFTSSVKNLFIWSKTVDLEGKNKNKKSYEKLLE